MQASPADLHTSPTTKAGRKRIILWVVAIAVVAILLISGGVYYFFLRPQGANSGSGQDANSLSDNDRDGLSLAQEVLYKTDPNNPDTDGDGFSDGEEVKTGHNPNGEGLLEKPTGSPYNGTPLSEVFGGKGGYVCNLVIEDPKLTVNVALKIKGDYMRQELVPQFSSPTQGPVDPVVLIRNGTVLFLGSGNNEKGWVKLTYEPDRNIATGPGVSITGGFFANQKEIEKANPKRVDCAPATIDDSEFVVLPQYILSDTQAQQKAQSQ